VAWYSPKQNAARYFFTLNFIAFEGVAGHSPKKDAAAPKSIEKDLFLYVLGWISDEMACFFSLF